MEQNKCQVLLKSECLLLGSRRTGYAELMLVRSRFESGCIDEHYTFLNLLAKYVASTCTYHHCIYSSVDRFEMSVIVSKTAERMVIGVWQIGWLWVQI
jgi:hypothetical protein